MNQADLIRLQHMRDAAAEALRFIAGKTRDELDQNRMLTLAVLKDLEILGEAARRVGAETRKAFPALPWDEVTGMRNRLIHGYFDVDLDVVWATLVNDLPRLLSEIEAVLRTSSSI